MSKGSSKNPLTRKLRLETSHLNVFPRLGLNIRKARFLFLPSVLPSFLPLSFFLSPSLSLFPRPCSTLVGHDSSNLTLANDGKGGRCYPLLSDTVATKSIRRYSYLPMKNKFLLNFTIYFRQIVSNSSAKIRRI